MNEFKSIKIEIDPNDVKLSKIYINDMEVTNIQKLKFVASVFDNQPEIEIELCGYELIYNRFSAIYKSKCPYCGHEGETIAALDAGFRFRANETIPTGQDNIR